MLHASFLNDHTPRHTTFHIQMLPKPQQLDRPTSTPHDSSHCTAALLTGTKSSRQAAPACRHPCPGSWRIEPDVSLVPSQQRPGERLHTIQHQSRTDLRPGRRPGRRALQQVPQTCRPLLHTANSNHWVRIFGHFVLFLN